MGVPVIRVRRSGEIFPYNPIAASNPNNDVVDSETGALLPGPDPMPTIANLAQNAPPPTLNEFPGPNIVPGATTPLKVRK